MMNVLKASASKPIIRSTTFIGLIAISSKFLGYIEKVVLAYYFGTSYQIDVYNVIISIIMAVFFFFRELTEPSFLPTFMMAIISDEKGAWDFFNRVGRYLLFVTGILSLLVFFFPASVITLFAPGFHGEERNVATKIIRLAFPACIFLSFSVLTNITLNGLKQFVIPAFSEVAFKLLTLLSLVLLFRYYGIYSLVFGLIIGALIKVIIHSLILYKKYSIKKLKVNPVYLQKSWQLAWPLLFGVTFSQINTLIDNYFASYMKEGTLSALSYAKKIIEFPILIFPYVLSVVIFPYFSELAAKNDQNNLSQIFLKSIYSIVLCFLPLSVFFFMFSDKIIHILLERGAFNAASTVMTATPFACYSIGMVFFAIETVLVVFYYAKSGTGFPILIGIICVIENVILTMVLINYFGYIGIALGLVISKTTKVFILLFGLRNRLTVDFLPTFIILGKILASALAFGLVAVLCKLTLSSGLIPFHSDKVYLATTFLLCTASYILGLILLKIKATF